MVGIVVIAWLVSAVVGALIGLPYGKPGKGALLGLFLGPIGWVLMIFDVGIGIIALALLAAVALLITGVRSYEEDQDRMQSSQQKAAQEMSDYRLKRASGQVLAELAASSPTPAPNTNAPSNPTTSEVTGNSFPSVTWSAFPEGVNTPEERRAYLQQKVEAKRQREAAAAGGGR